MKQPTWGQYLQSPNKRAPKPKRERTLEQKRSKRLEQEYLERKRREQEMMEQFRKEQEQQRKRSNLHGPQLLHSK